MRLSWCFALAALFQLARPQKEQEEEEMSMELRRDPECSKRDHQCDDSAEEEDNVLRVLRGGSAMDCHNICNVTEQCGHYEFASADHPGMRSTCRLLRRCGRHLPGRYESVSAPRGCPPFTCRLAGRRCVGHIFGFTEVSRNYYYLPEPLQSSTHFFPQARNYEECAFKCQRSNIGVMGPREGCKWFTYFDGQGRTECRKV